MNLDRRRLIRPKYCFDSLNQTSIRAATTKIKTIGLSNLLEFRGQYLREYIIINMYIHPEAWQIFDNDGLSASLFGKEDLSIDLSTGIDIDYCVYNIIF